MAETLGRRRFGADDLQQFAAASGDWNPIHVDPVRARRTLAGAQVAHGMFSLLWALDRHQATGAVSPQRVLAAFPRPIHLHDDVELVRNSAAAEVRLSVSHGSERLVSVAVSGSGRRATAAPSEGRPPRREPLDRPFGSLAGTAGRLEVSAAPGDLTGMFPALVGGLGPLPVAGIMALSRLVGMECPGLHSLFTRLDVRFDGPAHPHLEWRVTRHASLHAPLVLAVEGAGLSGTAQAFVRPRPVAQPSMPEVAAQFAAGEFAGHQALVLGGSRGLGELAAKALAAGGAEVVITFRSGALDAARVVDEIVAAGGACRAVRAEADDAPGLVAALQGWRPSHLYYFPTPRIGRQAGGAFDQELYAEFHRVYVTGFSAIVAAVAGDGRGTLHVLYPSTSFVDERPPDFAEYVAAKLAGEQACARLERSHPNLRVVIDRLPRMKTDQTASLLPLPLAPALQELGRVLRRMPRPDPPV